MTERGEWFNSEGYFDPTPAAALRNVQPSPGDIWTNTEGNPFLIVSVDKGFSITCGLMKNGELQDEIVHLNDKLDEMKVENSMLKVELRNARDQVCELQHDNEKLADKLSEPAPAEVKHDNVNHPAHYTAYKGVEVIQITEQMNFCRGNVVKYVCRAGLKDPATEKEDLEKAQFYLNRELERLAQ